MNYGLLTRRFIFFTVVIIGLFDLFMAAFGGPGTTISLQLFHMTGGDLLPFREKSLLFAFGFLAGHVFGRIDLQKDVIKSR